MTDAVVERLSAFVTSLDRDWTAALAAAYDTDPGSEIRPYAEARAAFRADIRHVLALLSAKDARIVELERVLQGMVDDWIPHGGAYLTSASRALAASKGVE